MTTKVYCDWCGNEYQGKGNLAAVGHDTHVSWNFRNQYGNVPDICRPCMIQAFRELT